MKALVRSFICFVLMGMFSGTQVKAENIIVLMGPENTYTALEIFENAISQYGGEIRINKEQNMSDSDVVDGFVFKIIEDKTSNQNVILIKRKINGKNNGSFNGTYANVSNLMNLMNDAANKIGNINGIKQKEKRNNDARIAKIQEEKRKKAQEEEKANRTPEKEGYVQVRLIKEHYPTYTYGSTLRFKTFNDEDEKGNKIYEVRMAIGKNYERLGQIMYHDFGDKIYGDYPFKLWVKRLDGKKMSDDKIREDIQNRIKYVIVFLGKDK